MHDPLLDLYAAAVLLFGRVLLDWNGGGICCMCYSLMCATGMVRGYMIF